MKKRILTVMLMIVMVFTMSAVTAVSAGAATTGSIGSSTYCEVKIDKKLINKKGLQYAKVKFNTKCGWLTRSAYVNVTLRDGNGRYICSWTAKGGDTFYLGDDHSVYRIYVSRVPSNSNNQIINNVSVDSWKVKAQSGCSIK